MKSLRMACFAALLGTTAVSQAAPGAGTMICAGNGGNLTLNISYFDLGLSQATNIGSGSSGAGAGKVTFQPLVIHTSLAKFSSLFDVAATGSHFTSCTLTTHDSSGGNIEFVMNTVVINSVSAIAGAAGERAPRFAFVKAEMEFGQIKVQTAGASDDGGVGPIQGGWDITKNQSE